MTRKGRIESAMFRRLNTPLHSRGARSQFGRREDASVMLPTSSSAWC